MPTRKTKQPNPMPTGLPSPTLPGKPDRMVRRKRALQWRPMPRLTSPSGWVREDDC